MTVEKDKSININYNVFLSLTSIHKIINKLTKFDKNKLRIVKHADFLLETNNYTAYANMISQGYVPTKSQQKTIDCMVDKILSYAPMGRSLEGYKSLELLLENGLRLTYQNIARFLHSDYTPKYHDSGALEHSSTLTLLYDKDHIISNKETFFPCISKQFHNIVNDIQFSDYFLKTFKKSLSTNFGKYSSGEKYDSGYITLERYKEVLEYAPQLIFRNASFEETSFIVKKLHHKEISKKNNDILNNIVNKIYAKDMSILLRDTKANYADNLVKSLTLDNIRSEIYEIDDVPKNALKLVENIEEIYKKIKNNGVEDIDKINQLNILLEKRIPEILSKYLKVDPDYRTTMVSSQGKNAEDLMINSLNNIKEIFDNVYEEINQNHINNLSATNRYTKNLKM